MWLARANPSYPSCPEPDVSHRGSGVSKLYRHALWETALRECFPKLTARCTSTLYCPVRGNSYVVSRGYATISSTAAVDKVGHDERILSLTFSSDGTWFASGSEDSTIILWDAATGQVVREWVAHTRAVISLKLSPLHPHLISVAEDNIADTLVAIVASDEKVIQIWDLAVETTNDPLLKLTPRGHTDWIRTVCFSPDGRHIASGSSDCTVRLWRSGDGTCLDVFMGHDGPVDLVRFTTDGWRIVAAVSDGTVLFHTLRDYSLDSDRRSM